MEKRKMHDDQFTPIKRVLNKESEEEELQGMPTIIKQCLCVQCGGGNGVTQLLLTSIPHFKELIIAAFECPDCNYQNNSVESAHQIADKGLKFTLTVDNQHDLNRRVVKGEHATVAVIVDKNDQEALIEIPAGTQKGTLNTVEGLLVQCMDDLNSSQPQRQTLAQEKLSSQDAQQRQEGEYVMKMYEKLQQVVFQLGKCLALQQSFRVVLDDPAGNSFIELMGSDTDGGKLAKEEYQRTDAQVEALGLSADQERTLAEQQATTAGDIQEAVKMMQQQLIQRDLARQLQQQQQPPTEVSNEVTSEEVLSFPSQCPDCHVASECKMKLISIPYFKEVLIMSQNCEQCGYKSNEVKASGAVGARGKRITLLVTSKDDLSRDLLKGESCGISVPELDLQLDAYTLGGRFTTIEGLLVQIRDELHSRFPYLSGDSDLLQHSAEKGDRRQDDADDGDERGTKMREFLRKLQQCIDQDLPFHFVMDDPLGGSYLQNPYAPDADPNMLVEDYERSYDQNEMLGLNDMDVETGVTYPAGYVPPTE